MLVCVCGMGGRGGGGGEGGGGVCSLANYSVAYEETQSNRVSDFRDFVCSLFPKATFLTFITPETIGKFFQQLGHLLIIPYQRDNFQSNNLHSFRNILHTRLKCSNTSRLFSKVD